MWESQAKFALPTGGTPNFQRTSSRSCSPSQSDTLNGGLARMKSKRSSRKASRFSVPSWFQRRSPNSPRMARFMRARRQVAWFRSCPKIARLSALPLCSSMKRADWTNMPPVPRQGSYIRPRQGSSIWTRTSTTGFGV